MDKQSYFYNLADAQWNTKAYATQYRRINLLLQGEFIYAIVCPWAFNI